MQSLEQIASCVAGYDPNALSVAQAQEFIARLVPRVAAVEQVALRSALGRVLAHDVVSAFNVPAHDNSAMDGYALRGADLRAEGATELPVAGTGLAGGAGATEVPSGHALRIMTGAVMPAGLDTVVPQEFTEALADGRVRIPAGVVRPGDNRRLAGEDLRCGEAALAAGRVLTPADLGLLASLGQAEVPVRRRLRVAFFSTGDELRSIGQPLDAGCVYDSNRYTLWGMLQRLGVELLDLGVVPDQPRRAGSRLHPGRGQRRRGDHLGRRQRGRGRPHQAGDGAPGRSAVLAHCHAPRPADGHRPPAAAGAPPAILFGLPGNPVAVMVTFYAFVRQALLQMSGADAAPLPMLRAASVEPLRKKPGRTEYQRGIVSRAASGEWQVRITGAQGSGILRSMSQANGMVVLHHEQGNVAAGELVDVIPFEGLV